MKDPLILETQERRILVITCIGHFLSHYNMLAFPAIVMPLTGRLHLNVGGVIGLSFWMYLLFGLTALPWGMVADRWKGTSLMLLFFLGAGLSGLAAALWIDSVRGLPLALACLGLFSGIYHPTGLGIISKGVRRLGMAMGYNGMMGNLGMAMAPLLTGVVNWLWGPRAAYLFLGGLNLLGFVLMLCTPIMENPHGHTKTQQGRDGLLRAFMTLLVAMMLGGIVYRGGTVILPTYIELKSWGILGVISGAWGRDFTGNLLATATASIIYTVGVLGQYFGGRVAERYDLRFSYLAFHAMTVPAAFLMAFATDMPLVALALIYFFFLLGMQPIENTLVARLAPHRIHHAAYGLKFVLTFGIGALAVKAVGWIQVTWGLEAVFPTIGMISLALCGMVLLLIFQTKTVWQGRSI